MKVEKEHLITDGAATGNDKGWKDSIQMNEVWYQTKSNVTFLFVNQACDSSRVNSRNVRLKSVYCPFSKLTD